MHEMSLCESLIGVIEDQASVHDYKRVRTVFLEIGSLACVEPEALRFSFDLVTRGTLAEGAALEIIKVTPQAWCFACGRTVTVQQRFNPCPDCGGYRLRLTGGDSLQIKQLEVD